MSDKKNKIKYMSRSDIESALSSIGENIRPVNLDAIKAQHPVAPAVKDGSVSEPKADRARGYFVTARKKFVYAVAALLAFAVLAGIPVGAIAYDSANTTELYIDSEESVKLVVSPRGTVRSAELLMSDDADIDIDNDIGNAASAAYQYGALSVISPISALALGSSTSSVAAADSSICDICGKLAELKGKEVSAAVDMVVSYMSDFDMLPDGCELIISTVGKNNSRAGKVAELARAAALKNKKAMLDEDTVTVLENIREAVKNISPAKLKFLKEAMAVSTGYTEKELRAFSAGYLRYLAKSAAGENSGTAVNRRISRYYEIYLRRLEKKAERRKAGNSEAGRGN
jgi:hypothetical protein